MKNLEDYLNTNKEKASKFLVDVSKYCSLINHTPSIYIKSLSKTKLKEIREKYNVPNYIISEAMNFIISNNNRLPSKYKY